MISGPDFKSILPHNVWVSPPPAPSRFEPEVNAIEDVIIWEKTILAVPVTNILEAVIFNPLATVEANEELTAFKTYDAVCAFCTNDAVEAFEALTAFWTNEAVKAYDELKAFVAYEALIELEANDELNELEANKAAGELSANEAVTAFKT